MYRVQVIRKPSIVRSIRLAMLIKFSPLPSHLQIPLLKRLDSEIHLLLGIQHYDIGSDQVY